MNYRKIGNIIDDVAEALELKGYEPTNYRANLSKGSEHPTYADSATEAIDQEISENELFAGFDVYPEGVEHPDTLVTVSYDEDQDAFIVNQNAALELMNPDQVDAAGEIAQTEKEEITSDKAYQMLEASEEKEGLFEHDKVEAMIERHLLDEGYDVIIGDAYEDGEKISQPVSEFP